ncbi:MAG: hypothetical protein EOP39_24870 [Rubrivivax sp.]|nr:MAG: hypothetical protein EOP39_24870 [Rubrivivax sp.]
MNPVLNPNDPNVAMLELVARRLGAPLCERFVFVGGAVAGLLITDAANPPIRPTEDVDVVVEVVSLSSYQLLEHDLRVLGFAHDQRADAPRCRWRVDGVTVDVMPTDESILGFSNRWYPLCIAIAMPLALPSGVSVRVVPAPVFIATKLEAFHGRGAGDYLFSHDLGDILSVVDGRDTLLDECAGMPAQLRGYLGEQFTTLLAVRRFRDALPGHLPGDSAGQSRLGDLELRLEQLARLERS